MTRTAIKQARSAPPNMPYGWVRMNAGFNSGVFHLGTECPPGWVGGAVPVSKIAQPLAQPAVQEPVAQDAEGWGKRLNDASWAAVYAWDKDIMGPMSGAVFNNIKGVIRVAILKYLEGYTTPPAPVPLTDELSNAVQMACQLSFKDHGRRSVNEQAWQRLMQAVAAYTHGITKGQP
jgi:hypothetical protein